MDGVSMKKSTLHNMKASSFANLNVRERSSSTKGNENMLSLQTPASGSLPYVNSNESTPLNLSSSSKKISSSAIKVSEEPYPFYRRYSETRPAENVPKVKSNYHYIGDSSKSEHENFSIYAETDLDQPTDYSLRYAEDDSDIEPQGNDGAAGKVATITEFIGDTIKTYCTEGTPYETPCNFSNATSMSDLRAGNDKTVHHNKELKTSENKNKEQLMSLATETTIEKSDASKTDGIQIPKNNVEYGSSGLMSPENPMNYCEEGTPGYFSRVSSFGSLDSGPAVCGVVPLKVSSCVNPEQPIAEVSAMSSKKDETMEPNKEVTNEAVKVVKFESNVNYYEETPLMFSRSSSLGSLDSIEQQSIHDDRSSIVSDFSRLTSGVISPSELPDSPTQTIPPSPKPQIAQQRTEGVGRSHPSSSNRRRSGHKNSVSEDETRKFKEESTPLEYSVATSLSSLTHDDQECQQREYSTVNEEKDSDEKGFKQKSRPSQKGPKVQDMFADIENYSIKSCLRPSISGDSNANSEKDTTPSESISKGVLSLSDGENSIRIYCTEDTPAVLSHIGSISDLSLSVLSMLDEEQPTNEVYLSENGCQISESKEIDVNCESSDERKMENVWQRLKDSRKSRSSNSSCYLVARDETSRFAVEDSPAQFSIRSSLSNLTIESGNTGAMCPQNIPNVLYDPLKIEKSDYDCGSKQIGVDCMQLGECKQENEHRPINLNNYEENPSEYGSFRKKSVDEEMNKGTELSIDQQSIANIISDKTTTSLVGSFKKKKWWKWLKFGSKDNDCKEELEGSRPSSAADLPIDRDNFERSKSKRWRLKWKLGGREVDNHVTSGESFAQAAIRCKNPMTPWSGAVSGHSTPADNWRTSRADSLNSSQKLTRSLSEPRRSKRLSENKYGESPVHFETDDSYTERKTQFSNEMTKKSSLTNCLEQRHQTEHLGNVNLTDLIEECIQFGISKKNNSSNMCITKSRNEFSDHFANLSKNNVTSLSNGFSIYPNDVKLSSSPNRNEVTRSNDEERFEPGKSVRKSNQNIDGAISKASSTGKMSKFCMPSVDTTCTFLDTETSSSKNHLPTQIKKTDNILERRNEAVEMDVNDDFTIKKEVQQIGSVTNKNELRIFSEEPLDVITLSIVKRILEHRFSSKEKNDVLGVTFGDIKVRSGDDAENCDFEIVFEERIKVTLPKHDDATKVDHLKSIDRFTRSSSTREDGKPLLVPQEMSAICSIGDQSNVKSAKENPLHSTKKCVPLPSSVSSEQKENDSYRKNAINSSHLKSMASEKKISQSRGIYTINHNTNEGSTSLGRKTDFAALVEECIQLGMPKKKELLEQAIYANVSVSPGYSRTVLGTDISIKSSQGKDKQSQLANLQSKTCDSHCEIQVKPSFIPVNYKSKDVLMSKCSVQDSPPISLKQSPNNLTISNKCNEILSTKKNWPKYDIQKKIQADVSTTMGQSKMGTIKKLENIPANLISPTMEKTINVEPMNKCNQTAKLVDHSALLEECIQLGMPKTRKTKVNVQEDIKKTEKGISSYEALIEECIQQGMPKRKIGAEPIYANNVELFSEDSKNNNLNQKMSLKKSYDSLKIMEENNILSSNTIARYSTSPNGIRPVQETIQTKTDLFSRMQAPSTKDEEINKSKHIVEKTKKIPQSKNAYVASVAKSTHKPPPSCCKSPIMATDAEHHSKIHEEVNRYVNREKVKDLVRSGYSLNNSKTSSVTDDEEGVEERSEISFAGLSYVDSKLLDPDEMLKSLNEYAAQLISEAEKRFCSENY